MKIYRKREPEVKEVQLEYVGKETERTMDPLSVIRAGFRILFGGL